MTERRQTVISAPTWLYNRIADYYRRHKEELAKWGVKSVNGLAVEWLKLVLSVKENRDRDVKEALQNNTQP